MRSGRVGWTLLAVGMSVLGAESLAQAQAPAPRAPAQAPAGQAAAATQTSTAVEPVPEELLKTSPEGLTAQKVGERAAQTSYTAKASEETIRGAAARVDAAWAQFLPRLTGTARYTRLSNFTPPSLSGAGSLVGTLQTDQITNVNQLAPVNFAFPLVLDNYLLQANIVVPISDYFLKINQNYTSATKAVEAARYDAATARAKSGSDGKAAYYTWMRARGSVIVAVQALNEQRTHLNDARNQFTVGNASRADTLRAETAVAAAELQVERAKNLADLTEKQMRVAMHVPDSEKMVPGEPIDSPPPPVQGNPRQLIDEALSQRLEIRSIDANAEVARKQANAIKAGRYPAVSAFGDAIYANPNPRVFPATSTWFPTWDVGVQATWSPNDILTANGNASDAESRAAQLDAQKQVTRDGIEIEVTQAWQQVKEQDVALESTKRELASATEAHRVARELFNNGRATSTTLTDAEGELTRARLDALNALIDARIARVRLEHALGRDTKGAVQP